jgi:hypothetical protein
LKSSVKSTVERKEVKFKTDNIDFIKSEHPAFHLENANGSQLFIYPAFILLIAKAGEADLIELKEINFSFRLQRFIEPKISIPSDTRIIDYAWAKVNKDGSPDMRFKGNYQTPVVHYGLLNFISSTGLNETYYISNSDVAQNFANEFSRYLDLLNQNENNSSIISNTNVQPLSTTSIFTMPSENKIFTSNTQSILQGDSTQWKVVEGVRTIRIQNERFRVELPDNSVLSGKLSYQLLTLL